MYTRSLHPPKTSFFLFGPRGTGKTSFLKKHFPSAFYIDLLESDYYEPLLARPQLLEELIPTGHKDWIILDEVQKIPALLNQVHRLIESRKLKFILTGSSARSLRKKGVNLLGGRAMTLYMYPLTAHELGADFSLSKSLQFGNLPSVYVGKEPKKYLKSYIQSYLREEVLQEGLVRNLSSFARFLESATFSQAGVLNISDVARDSAVDRKVVEGYFSILEDLLIAKRITVFSKKAKRALIKSSKFFYFDNGVYRVLRPKGPLDSDADLDGASLETLLFQEILALNEYFDWEYGIHFWRTKKGEEVDFVLYGSKGLVAIEVKRSVKVRSDDLDSLKLFKKDYPMAKCFLAYGGTKKIVISDIECVPYQEFLVNLSQYISLR